MSDFSGLMDQDQPEENEILKVYRDQRARRNEAKNTSAAYRLKKLKAFKKLLVERKADIAGALYSDFRKPAIEADLTEIMPVISMINLFEKKLPAWMRDEKVKGSLLFAGTKSWIRREGKGNCLIISPWNYPFQLAAYPILTAFAAGNTCVVKPSEFTPNTNKILKSLFEQVFSRDEVAFIEGEAQTSSRLLELPFDHVFFTGSTHVGAIVARAAAKNLAGTTLELGGKSPCVWDGEDELDTFAARIVWGKLVNAGQTCVAPDYIVTYRSKVGSVCEALRRQMDKLYPKGEYVGSSGYAGIATQKHAARLCELVDDAKAKGARVIGSGKYHEDTRVLEPVVLANVSVDSKIMREEIFGPVLPVLGFDSKEQMLKFINERDNPLALYVFSRDKIFQQLFLENTCSGGVTLNDTLINVAHPNLPFGGAGKSGLGKYHGKWGFEEFSNQKAVVKRNRDLGTSFFYPPYGKMKVSVVDWLLRRFSWLF